MAVADVGPEAVQKDLVLFRVSLHLRRQGNDRNTFALENGVGTSIGAVDLAERPRS